MSTTRILLDEKDFEKLVNSEVIVTENKIEIVLPEIGFLNMQEMLDRAKKNGGWKE